MKTKFITAIYSKLSGTKYGGRQSRFHHYRYSLLSILKITNADFICYTSAEEIDELKSFFYIENEIPVEKLKLIPYSLDRGSLQNLIFEYKDYEKAKSSDRCIEIQYLKFDWLSSSITCDNYDNYYWIDAGLSYCGLFPNKYLNLPIKDNPVRHYYECSIFSDEFLKCLSSFHKEKLFIIGRNNNGTEQRVPEYFFPQNEDYKYHTIGGLFGGNAKHIKNLCKLFFLTSENIINKTKNLYSEEHILSAVYSNNKNIFTLKNFDTWWHENTGISGVTDDPSFFKDKKSFYKIFEELLNY